MQNTRLNTLFDRLLTRTTRWLQNPWRRLSLIALGLLFGFFLANAISTISGQAADLDVLVAAILVVIVEVINRVIYTSAPVRQSAWGETINALKIGTTYGFFLEAFKLGS